MKRGTGGWRWGRLLLAACLVVAAGMADTARGYEEETTVALEEGSGLEMRVSFPFGDTPSYGFVPWHLQIANRTGRDLEWEVKGQEQGGETESETSVTVAVGAGQSRDFDLLMPVAGMETGGGGSAPSIASLSSSLSSNLRQRR